MSKIIGALVMIGAAIITIIVLGLLFALPVMLLWNSCLVSAVTFAKPISLLQAWGINILSGFIFKKSENKSSN